MAIRCLVEKNNRVKRVEGFYQVYFILKGEVFFAHFYTFLLAFFNISVFL